MMIESEDNLEDYEAKRSSDIIENLLEKKWNSKREAKDEVCFRLGELPKKKLVVDRKKHCGNSERIQCSSCTNICVCLVLMNKNKQELSKWIINSKTSHF